MQVVSSVHGVFHHFDLARELESLGHLQRIYSSFPWRRLAREGVPRERVRSFPWIHPALLAFERRVSLPKPVSQTLHTRSMQIFDQWVAGKIEDCDVLVALSGSGLKTGAVVQSRGGRYVCDRGSSHIRYQDAAVTEEYARWGFPLRACDPAMVRREEAEYERADLITVPSEFARRTFLEMGIASEKVKKVPYGVRLDRFRKTGSPPQDRFEVLFAGTVSLRKGVPYLLEAFQRFQHPKKRLRIAGPVEPAMVQTLRRFDLTHVEVLGRQTQPQLAELMSTSHVMVLPSIEEGLALVQGQALACGCPLISSVNTGGEDLFTDGKEGFLVPIRSPETIQRSLEKLADAPGLQGEMSVAALERVTSIGGWRDYGLAYVSVLNDLLQKHSENIPR
ncbi:glycosyltransferase [Silvibacterium dinghuense]|uniref:Glycosyltransferase n=2 Tax=Silvibacterium dinghuense TaxID=1560006 RepID=A0A4Q1SEL5_9BACT|nr:glycosyltransferase [Silvibacterium dinghuense]